MDKRLIIGIAAGVAVAAAAGILFATKKKSKKQIFQDKADDLSENFRRKLQNLQKRAQKEFKQAVENGEDYTHLAQDRANELAKRATANFL